MSAIQLTPKIRIVPSLHSGQELALGKSGRCSCANGLQNGPACGPALVDRRVRRQPFRPHLLIVVKALFVVVDEYPRSEVRQ